VCGKRSRGANVVSAHKGGGGRKKERGTIAPVSYLKRGRPQPNKEQWINTEPLRAASNKRLLSGEVKIKEKKKKRKVAFVRQGDH